MIAMNISNDRPKLPRREVTGQLCRRIWKLIKNHPEILTSSTAECILDYPEFEWGDLNPTLREVVWAFEITVGMWKTLHKDPEKP